MGWSQSDFEFCEPRYLFNAIKGIQRADMEQARLIGYYTSIIHSGEGFSFKNNIFPWENPKDYEPKFPKVDKEAFDRISAWQFPSDN